MKATSVRRLAMSLLGALMCASMWFVGCSAPAPTVECQTGDDCPDGWCDRYDGVCVPWGDSADMASEGGCYSGRCGEGEVCVGEGASASCVGTCAQIGEPCGEGGRCTGTDAGVNICFVGDAGAGSECEFSAQCEGGASCVTVSAGAPGRCMASCSEPGALCEDGSLCIASGGAGICYAGGAVPEGGDCESLADCERGRRCVSAGERKYCVRACATDAGCDAGMSCDELPTGGGKVCRPRVGAACESSFDCDDELTCSLELEDIVHWVTVWPGGYCTSTACDPTANTGCDSGADCKLPGGVGPVCVQACVTDADCRVSAGWECLGQEACTTPGCRAYFGARRYCGRLDRVESLGE